jgi:hypothetical protein
MIRSAAMLAALSGALLGACQTGPASFGQRGTPVDGTWIAGNQESVTTFNGGRMTTNLRDTGELVADGTYHFNGGTLAAQWVALRDLQNRSATCTLTQPDTLNCESADGQTFVLNRA